MAGVGLPHVAVREQVADALHLVVCQERAGDGRRRITSVAEVVRVAGGAGVRELYTRRDGRGRPAGASNRSNGMRSAGDDRGHQAVDPA